GKGHVAILSGSPATSSKPKKAGPSVSDLIVKAVSASKERHGLSLAGLKKALAAGGYDVEKNNARVKLAVKSLVSKGALVQTRGTGASGSFKINKKQAEGKEKASKKKAAPKKKPAAKKPTAAAKKVKKPAAKKTRSSQKDGKEARCSQESHQESQESEAGCKAQKGD
uniref:Histone H1 n=1 Tax=Erpetoichthys calabaricus TaxID=27687 RepID=A0A8C4RE16_ERPCA